MTHVKLEVADNAYTDSKSLLHVKLDPVELALALFLAATCMAFVIFKGLALYVEKTLSKCVAIFPVI